MGLMCIICITRYVTYIRYVYTFRICVTYVRYVCVIRCPTRIIHVVNTTYTRRCVVMLGTGAAMAFTFEAFSKTMDLTLFILGAVVAKEVLKELIKQLQKRTGAPHAYGLFTKMIATATLFLPARMQLAIQKDAWTMLTSLLCLFGAQVGSVGRGSELYAYGKNR